MAKCKICGAIWKVVHPFGKNSKSRCIFIREHHKKCRYNMSNKKRKRK